MVTAGGRPWYWKAPMAGFGAWSGPPPRAGAAPAGPPPPGARPRGSSARVWVGPPFQARGPSLGSTPTRLRPTPLARPPVLVASSMRLLRPAAEPWMSPPEVLLATMVLFRVMRPERPPPRAAELP